VKQSGKTDNSFVTQAGILAAAGIISRVIGLLYRSPLSSVIGPLGLGYYNSAYAYYTIILLISSYSIPSAISKVIAQKLAVKEYRNAHRLFWGSLFYVLVVGAIGSLILFFGAGLFVEDAAIPVLRVFAPTVFIYGLLGVLRGYFQAHRSMVQTSVSQILEQIANAAVSIGAAVLLIRHFFGTLEVPADESLKVSRAVYGAMGSALGTGAGVVVGLLFMFLAYRINRPDIHRRVERDKHEHVDSYGTIIKTITFTVTPFILSTAVYNLVNSLNTKLFTDFYPSVSGLSKVAVTEDWGIFGCAQTVSNIPIAFASAMAAAMIPSIAALVASTEIDVACEKIGIAVKTTMLISIPCAVGLFILSGPVMVLLFPTTADYYGLARGTLMTLCLSVAFYAYSTLNSSILQGLGKVNTPIRNAGIALVIQTACVLFLLKFTSLGVYSVAVANAVYSGTMAFLNQWAVRKAVGYEQEINKTILRPILASLVMGLVAGGVYLLLHLVAGISPRIAVLPAILLAVPVYFAALLLSKAVDEEELMNLPKGRLMVRIARKLHLLR
jgi:stage V sporulation protein B